MAYNVIQYGVSVFQHHPEEDRYVYRHSNKPLLNLNYFSVDVFYY